VEQLQGFLSTQTPNLPHSTIGHARKTAHFAAKIEKKLYKQLIAQHREVFEEIRKVKNQIQPEGTVQERVLSLAAFPNYSPFSLIALLYASCNPFAFRLTKITI
jgi:hypothetical protein